VLGNDSDTVGTIDPASVAVSTKAGHGTTSIDPTTGKINYTPTTGYTGTDTFQYTVANTQGGVSSPTTVTVTVNGSSSGGGSGSGSGAQLPNLCAGYAARPSWQVAGVDYAVGAPSVSALKNPAGISMRGVSVNATSHVITV